MAIHTRTCNPSTQDAEAGGFHSSRPQTLREHVWYGAKMSRRAGCGLLCFSRWLPASEASQGPDCHCLGSKTQLLCEGPGSRSSDFKAQVLCEHQGSRPFDFCQVWQKELEKYLRMLPRVHDKISKKQKLTVTTQEELGV